MHHFVLFSVILIAASVIVLLIPSTLDEGFKNNSPRLIKQTAPSNRAMGHSNPTAAGQRNSSSTAGAADGSSNHQHLMDRMLKKQDTIAEAFENRDEQSLINFTSQNNLATTDPSCSTCKLTQRIDRCVLPGCYSADGYLPFPDDDGYRFAEGCFYYNPNKGQTIPGMQGRSPGYYCPPITQGRSYDGGGDSGDPCYTTNGALSYAKYVRMNNVCSNDKATSNQNFVPGKDAPIDDNYTPPPRNTSNASATASKTSATASKATASKATASKATASNTSATASKTSATASTINHVHHVYHHEVDSNNNSNTNNNGCSYMEPVPGAGILGFA